MILRPVTALARSASSTSLTFSRESVDTMGLTVPCGYERT